MNSAEHRAILVEFLLVLLLIVAVTAVLLSPFSDRLRREDSASSALLDLEAAKEAKYSEIRDAELDLRTGKLSQQDYDQLNTQLRAEAVELLRKIDALSETETPERDQSSKL